MIHWCCLSVLDINEKKIFNFVRFSSLRIVLMFSIFIQGTRHNMAFKNLTHALQWIEIIRIKNLSYIPGLEILEVTQVKVC